MSLSKAEKKFWKRHYRIEKLKDIPTQMKGILAIETDLNDEYLFFVTQRVPIIKSFDLENTQITDVGIQYIATVQQVESLALKANKGITKNCLPFINTLKDLKLLNLMKTSVTLSDVLVLKDLQQLSELYLSSEDHPENYLEEIRAIKKLFPYCKLYLNYELIDSSDE